MASETTANAATGRTSGKWLKIALAALAVVALILVWLLLPMRSWLESFTGWVQGLGPLGWLIYAAVYVALTVAMGPASVLTLLAGFAYGLSALPLVIVSATLAAATAFLLARTVLRERVAGWVAGRPRFQAIERAVGEEGWRIVGLMRLSPALPFNLQNYFFGITPVGFWGYTIATFFGIMPGTFLYVWLGSIGQQAATGGEASTARYILLGVGLVATLAVTVLVTKRARAKLQAMGVAAAEQGQNAETARR